MGLRCAAVSFRHDYRLLYGTRTWKMGFPPQQMLHLRNDLWTKELGQEKRFPLIRLFALSQRPR
jgi:hypothetical protein